MERSLADDSRALPAAIKVSLGQALTKTIPLTFPHTELTSTLVNLSKTFDGRGPACSCLRNFFSDSEVPLLFFRVSLMALISFMQFDLPIDDLEGLWQN